jgi:hypothetical protein
MNLFIAISNPESIQDLLDQLEKDGHKIHIHSEVSKPVTPDLAGLEFDRPDVVINLHEEIERPHLMYSHNVEYAYRALVFAHRVGAKAFLQLDMNSGQNPPLYTATKAAANLICLGFSAQEKQDGFKAIPVSLHSIPSQLKSL